jgi:hypothetical protein
MSTQPLTPAEQAAAEALDAAEFDSELALINEGSREEVARAVVAAVRPELAAEFYESMAVATEKNGALTPEGLRACALLARQSLSRPTSEEH